MKYELHKKNKKHSNGDGYITRLGHTIFQQDIVDELNFLESKVERLEFETRAIKSGGFHMVCAASIDGGQGCGSCPNCDGED